VTAAESEALFTRMFAGALSEQEIAAVLTDLHLRGESVDDILGAARAALKVRVPFDGAPVGAIDTCGTGGDGLNTFNVSTAVALAAAASGIPVVKHGNRASTSRSGSADVLEALGFTLERDAAAWRDALATQHFAFLFAPVFHPSFKRVAAVRKALPHRTIFNLLGPLLNPAGVERQVLGVFSEAWVEPLAQVLAGLGRRRALVVHGGIGVGPTDELAPWGSTRVAEVRDGRVVRVSAFVPPVSSALPADVRGDDAAFNAARIKEVLAGAGHKSALALVALNLAAAFFVAGRAESFESALPDAETFLSSGAAARFWGF
jgi:anthranilate phosphoribosyltransferase